MIFQQPVEPKANFSVTSMSEAAQGLLEGSAMKVTRAADLVKDFNAQIANWNRVAASKEGRTDARTGAEMFGAVQALLSSARKVLPDGYRGNVHTLMQWASVYAGMAETGQLPAAGALKANAFYAASEKLNEQHGNLLTEEQLREGALQAVGRMLELSAQPQTRTQKSIFQNGSGMLGKMTFAMKSESINKLGLWLAQLTRDERMSPLGLWLSSGIAASIVNYLAEWLQGGDDDEYVLKNHLVSAAVSIAAGPLRLCRC